MEVRDRIIELRRVKASKLLPNPKNWRRHPDHQADALRGVLSEVGYAGALVARETPDGLVLIDGHLRAETTPDAIVPVLILDVTEAESDTILATMDPLGAMAHLDGDAFTELMESVTFDSAAVGDMLEALGSGSYEPLTPLPEPVAPAPRPDSDNYSEQFGVIVVCDGEKHQSDVYEELRAKGYNCKVVVT